MNEIFDYKTVLNSLGISMFFMVFLSAAMLEIYLLISPVRGSSIVFLDYKGSHFSLSFASGLSTAM